MTVPQTQSDEPVAPVFEHTESCRDGMTCVCHFGRGTGPPLPERRSVPRTEVPQTH